MTDLKEIKKHVSYSKKYNRKLWNVKFKVSQEDFKRRFPEIEIKETIQEFHDQAGYENPDRKIISIYLPK